MIAIAITVSRGDAGAATVVDFSGAVADVAGVECSNAGVDIVADAIGIGIGRTRTTALAQHVIREARPIVVCCCRVVVAGKGVGAPFDFIAVTHAIGIGVCRAVTTADAEGIGLIAIAITVSRGDAGAATVVDFSGAVADVAGVECSNAGVDIVADAISIGIGRTRSTALAQHVIREARPIVVCCCRVVVAGKGVGAPFDFIAVTHAIGIGVCRAVTTANAEGIGLIAIAITVSKGDAGAATVVDFSGAVADVAGVECSNAGVDIVADAIAIGIGRTRTTALAQHVIREARPIVVCCCRVVVAGKGVGAPFDFIAVTHAIGIGVCRAVTTANAEGIGLIAIAITVSKGDAGAATVVDFSGAVADVAGVECSNAGVDIVADAISIGIGRTRYHRTRPARHP